MTDKRKCIDRLDANRNDAEYQRLRFVLEATSVFGTHDEYLDAQKELESFLSTVKTLRKCHGTNE